MQYSIFSLVDYMKSTLGNDAPLSIYCLIQGVVLLIAITQQYKNRTDNDFHVTQYVQLFMPQPNRRHFMPNQEGINH